MNSLVPYLEVANEYIVMLKNENAELKAQADGRLELLRDLAAWYSDTANAPLRRYLPIELVERLEKELADENN